MPNILLPHPGVSVFGPKTTIEHWLARPRFSQDCPTREDSIGCIFLLSILKFIYDYEGMANYVLAASPYKSGAAGRGGKSDLRNRKNVEKIFKIEEIFFPSRN